MKITKRHKTIRGALALTLLALSAQSVLLPSGALADVRRRLRLERIEVSGNRHIPDREIVSSMSIAPGDEIDAETIDRQRELILGDHGLIRSVEFYTEPGSQRGLIVLQVEIVEKKKYDFETGIGYHDRYGWFLTLAGLRIESPFGTDSHIRFGYRLGHQVDGFEIEWIGNTGKGDRFGYEARLYAYDEQRIFYDWREDPGTPLPEGTEPGPAAELTKLKQDIERTGIEIGVRYESHNAVVTYGANFEEVIPDSTLIITDDLKLEGSSFYPASIRPGIKETYITGVFLRLIRDTRDDFVYPTKGNYSYLRLQVNNSILGGDDVFARARFEHVSHIDLGGYRTLALRAAGGAVSENAPYHEKFLTGGTRSVRGYRDWSLSPPAGDDGFWMAGAELRVPLTGRGNGRPRLCGLLFIEAGQGWTGESELDADDIKASAGYGMRMRLPWLGTFGVDAGVPLTGSPAGDKYYVHGSLGFSF
ncbi:MAG TPA: BamA/TamA family outer membrane protein, partial [Candidatus Krumholzibacterium sp.]|nr:BamA/TamA family outer membrane protein [Candidatus Krumholzibacterium sp.]